MAEYPPLDPNFRNRYMVDVEEGPDTRQQFTLPLARAQRAAYERPGVFGHWFGGARGVVPPTPWDPDRPRPELASPNQPETPFEYAVKPLTNLGSAVRGAGSLVGSVFNPPLTPPERPVTGNLPPTERSAAEDIEYSNRLGKFGFDTALNMIGAGRLPGASPPGAVGTSGAAPTLRGRAGEEAWRRGTAEERLRTTNHPWGGTTPIRDMPKPIIEGAPNYNYKPINVEKDLKNAELIFMPGDATGAGGRLVGFEGMPRFENPVNRMGGNQYAQLMEHLRATGMTDDQIQRLWASMQGPMAGIFNVAKGVEARGNVPWGVYMTGGKQYMDQATQAVQTAIEAANATGVSNKANKHIVNVMRSDWNYPADPELLFPKEGLKNPDAVKFWLDNQPMPARAKLVKAMATAEAQKLGFPDPGMLRTGNADPRLLTAQPGSAGLMLGRIDTSSGLIKPSLHPDYSTAIAGSDLRTFGRQLPVDIIAPTMHQQRVAAFGDNPATSMYLKAPHKYYGAMGTPQKTEPVTNQWREGVQNWLANNPEQRIGGVVLGAGANDPKSVALAAGLNAVRDPQGLSMPGFMSSFRPVAAGMERVRTPQGTMNEIPAWMNRPRDFFPDLPGGVTFDKSLPMDVNSVMSRWAASPYQREAYHWTPSEKQFSQFKNAEDVDRWQRDFGIHAGTAGQAENRAYNRGNLVIPGGTLRGGTYGQTYKLLVDPGPRGFIQGVEDSGTWGPLATRGHLERSGKFTPGEIHRARSAPNDLEQLQNYRDLVRSKGYGGLEYFNKGEIGGGLTQLSLEKDRLSKLALQETDYGRKRDLNNKVYDLENEIARVKVAGRENSIAIADPSQIRVPGAMFNPANRGNPFILGAGANDPKSVALAAGLNAVRDPQSGLGSTVRNAAEPIRAYHSSPHDFDRFDMSKIGTGEGAQVYGHGIYAAENPKVSGQGGEYWNAFKHRFAYSPAESEAVNMLQNHNFDREKAIAEMEDLKRYQPGYLAGASGAFDRGVRQHIIDKNNEALELLKSGKLIGPRTYEVNIHARPEQFLSHDLNLNKQSPEVKDALSRAGFYQEGPYRSGALFYQDLADRGTVGQSGAIRQAAASEKLLEAGIPGIRYLDQGSRPAANLHAQLLKDLEVYERSGNKTAVESIKQQLANPPQGTSNYVIFDPGIIEIAKKYGIPGMLGAGALGETVRQDRYGG